MMWRVEDAATTVTPGPAPASLSSAPASPASSSLISVSMRTPGSGVALDSGSFSSVSPAPPAPDSDTDTAASASAPLSRSSSSSGAGVQPPLATEATEQWSEEVELMLAAAPPSKFQSFSLSGDPSLSSWVLPSPSHAAAASESAPLPRTASMSPVPEAAVSSSYEPREDFTGHLLGDA